jgi:A/G-specific adenine glycosylase
MSDQRDAAPVDFASTLIAWQREHGRHDLPWQHGEAYGVWVSEIMLQQTQVQTVIGYYARFMTRFPTLQALAAADEAAVMEAWSGLGYYARARNLHRAARAVVTRFGGAFPRAVEDIESLPGIGRSTAAAIASFCFGAHEPILDGNVKRVFARVFGVEGFPGLRAIEQHMWSLAREQMPDEQGRHLHASLDGFRRHGLHTRSAALCRLPGERPLHRQPDGTSGENFRRRDHRRTRPLRLRFALLIITRDQVLLERRPGQGIWGGLLSLPELAAQTLPDAVREAADWAAARGLACGDGEPLAPLVHGFTHFELHLVPLRLRLDSPTTLAGATSLHWLTLDTVGDAALPAPVRRLFARSDME